MGFLKVAESRFTELEWILGVDFLKDDLLVNIINQDISQNGNKATEDH